MDSTFTSEMIGVFFDEVEDQLQTMEQEILKLEQGDESNETIQSLFRAAHTLKGSSAAMGFEEMKQLTHEMEHILDQVRNHLLQVTNTLINLLFNCLDHLRLMKEELMAGDGISSEITSLVEQLQRFISEQETLTLSGDVVTGTIFQSTRDMEVLFKVEDAQEQGLIVLDVRVKISKECLMKSARAMIIFNQLHSIGDVLHTVPSLDDIGEDEASLSEEIQFLLATQAEASQVRDIIISIMDVTDAEVIPFAPSEWGDQSETVTDKSVTPRSNEKLPTIEEGKRRTQTIRVDVERLEHLMNLVGELVIDQTRLRQVGSILNHRYTSDDDVGELGQISDHVSRVIGELQENVVKVRMLPIDQLFKRFPRMIRDLAQSLNKEIDFIVEGQETEVDRSVIEEVGDPLIHLIRNAVDHGIEPAEERRSKGKPEIGQLRISASHEENQVVIKVEDDGAGIDPQKIKDSAVRKGIISEDEAKKMSEQEATHLIFRPGFSTASSVSDVSGRGVGMDIVRNQIEKLSGVIDIETKLGKGTRFKIKLPLTLAIITGLLIKLSGRTFVLPMSSVVEIVRMPPEMIQSIKGDSMVVIREQVLPVVWLHDHFNIPRAKQEKKQLPIVVVGTAEKRIALIVDELNGNQEIVVKSLGTYVGKVEGVSGATILGDGRVALILGVSEINKMSSRL